MTTFRFFRKDTSGKLDHMTRSGVNIEMVFAGIHISRVSVLRTNCAMLKVDAWNQVKTQDFLADMVDRIKLGLERDSFFFNGEKWVDAYGQNWYKNSEAIVSTFIPVDSPKKRVPVIPLEVFQDKERLRHIDYMSAVRDMCKGMR